eukprot:CAMPEP_0118645234 /NCGR_PEP_ID=MMETSP0785-20121206/7387_1 /TAXON_ID=91992 /ORGANISM="Bolidomonas pacifica, Strain CCMP 1866" /LENGTH=809 /DNA_ID=CAMNT_0006537093 /DNA_START=136 /DNA_END=2561 /DNA_ORIENTATION=-
MGPKKPVLPEKEDATREASSTIGSQLVTLRSDGEKRLTGKSGRIVRIRKATTSGNLYDEQLKDAEYGMYNAQKKEWEFKDTIIQLPRGGTIVNTDVGGYPLAEFEFPAYFNFFCLKKKVTLICIAELETRVRAIFTETLLGPDVDNCEPEKDHAGECDKTAHPNFREEGYYLDGMRRTLNVDTLIEFKTFDAKNEVNIEDSEGNEKIKIKLDVFSSSYRVQLIDKDVPTKDGQELAKIDDKFTYKRTADPVLETDQIKEGGAAETFPFDPPKFGMTVLGSSHGFDPSGSTTGFVIWVKGRGIMVDPPPYASIALEKLSIPPRLIEGVILTHCHADHDAGTFQKILKEKSINIYTTPTIFESFLRKYAAISGFGGSFLMNLFTFNPVQIGKPTVFNGAEIHFYYSFHTIPCIGFQVHLDGESMVYSADTNSDKAVVEKMFEDGAIGQQRRDMLINNGPLSGDHSLIFHEAGVPPIHTPMKLLCDLPENIKQKMFVVHVTPSQIPKDSKLRQANAFDTLDIDMHDRSEGGDSATITNFFQLLSSLDIFNAITLENCRDIVPLSNRKTYEKGTLISASNTPVDVLTIFTAGIAYEKDQNHMDTVVRAYKAGDYNGEIALVDNDVKSRFMIEAFSQVHITLEVPIEPLKKLLTDETTITMIKGYSELQRDSVWSAMSRNIVFNAFSNSQRKDFLENLGDVEEFNSGDSIELQSCGVFIVEATVQVLLDPSSVDEEDLSTYRGGYSRMDFIDCEATRGDFLADINIVLNDRVTYLTCETTSEKVTLRRLERTKLVNFLTRNPGLLVQLLDTRIL